MWTIHNLLPIDGTASEGVLARADVLLTHTESDAAYLSGRASFRDVRVGGWGGLSRVSRTRPAPQTLALAERLRSSQPAT